MKLPDGANCADLPAFVVDKYFHSDGNRDRFKAKVGLAICARCKVLEACREQAMTMPAPPARGVIAGLSATALQNARSWRNYELGVLERPPRNPRPPWLELSDASQSAEEARLAEDPDEPPPEI